MMQTAVMLLPNSKMKQQRPCTSWKVMFQHPSIPLQPVSMTTATT